MTDKQNKLKFALVATASACAFNALAATSEAVPTKGKPHAAAPRIAGPKSLNTPAVQSYLGRLRSRILQNWMLADGKNVVVVSVSVTPDGAVSDLSTAGSKADDLAIQSATVAFDKAQPLEHLPPEADSTVKISVTFTSSVDPHGDSNSNVTTRIDMLPKAPASPATTATPAAPAESTTETPAQK